MQKEISVILTTYNRAEVLKRAIRSVLNQTYKDFELVIIDDCSQDNTEETVKSFNDKRIIYFKTPQNYGSSGARNFGFRKSTGKYIAYLDDDNEFLPEFLSETVALLKTSSPEIGGIKVGRVILMGKGIPEYKDYATPITHTGFDSIDWGFLMRREVLENIQYDPNIYGDEDADFGIQFAKKYKSAVIDKPLQIAHAYIDEGSVCLPGEKRLKGLEYFIKKNLNDYKKDRNELRYLYRLAGRNFYRGGYKLKGITYFWKSFLAKKSYRSFLHFFFALFSWEVYDWFMDREERRMARYRLFDYDLRRN